MVGWASSGLHPRSHLFIIKFHVYRQPVRWRSEFLSECVHTRPRGGKRERQARRHTHARPRVHMHIRVNGHIDERARVRGWILPPLSLSRFFSFSRSLSFPIARGSGKARIRSAVNLKINIDRGAANPLFIDADCWLHGRDAPRRLLLSPSYPTHSIP